MPENLSSAEPLKVSQLCVMCDPSVFDFKTTKSLTPLDELIGQTRALDAIRMAAKIRHHDFNLFVLGNPGSGRHTAVSELLAKEAGNRPVPDDWVYVNNFEAPHKPIAIKLVPGMAIRLKLAMEALVDELANNIPAFFVSEDYQTQRRNIEQKYGEEHEQTFHELSESAKKRSVVILRTPMGFAVAATLKDEVIKPEEYEALSKKKQKEIDENVAIIQKGLEAVLKQVPKRDKLHRHAVEELNARIAEQGVADAIDDVLEEFKSVKAVKTYLATVRADLIRNADIFLDGETSARAGAFPVATTKYYAKPQFQRYSINVMISNDPTGAADAPVESEVVPTLSNLIGRVEHVSEMGTLTTNFTMIKPGALHRANGGYLILDARQVLSEPFAWEVLKRCLQAGAISIISASEKLGLTATTSLEPDPIPLNVRIVLIGDRMLYYLLASLDPDFHTLFKLQADFNDVVEFSSQTMHLYASMVASIAERENLRPLNPAGVARLLIEGARLVDDTERLSLNMGHLSDILREADYWTAEAGRKIITNKDIEKSIEAAEQRAGRIRDLSHEMITRGTVLIDTDGEKIGQINALSVMQIGKHRFGQPSRVTARVRMGTGKVVDIEREVELGGSLHSKGVLILSSYLATNYALDVPMSLWASIAFEQSYGGVDGDSASAAELFALLSALSKAPIDQSFAVTGSVNQQGEIQAIGGINEKIEGFFDICATRGLTGQQGILMPISNVKNLVLRPRIIDAVENSKFKIIPIKTIDQGIELLTDKVAGVRNKDGEFPANSINSLVESRLTHFAKRRVAFAKSAKANGAVNEDHSS